LPRKKVEILFKSIYTKYLMSFIALLGLGFVAIAIIMNSILTNYSIDTKEDLMYQTAKIIYSGASTTMKSSGLSFSEAVEANKSGFLDSCEPLSGYSDSIIMLTDQNGGLLLCVGEGSKKITAETLEAETVKGIKENSDSYKYSSLDGLFEKRRFNYRYPVKDATTEGEPIIGMIILSSSSTNLMGIFEQISKIIVIASLWVFLAAIVAVYFITDRIITPLKDMSAAAASYSKGDFEVRVPVKGTDEIASLAEAFNTMAQSLKTLDTTRATFLSNVSHDLRTPMTSIQGFIDGILDGTIPADKQSYYLKVVSGEVKRLSRLVNSLLDISRMESGNLKLNKVGFDVCEVARLILISFEEKIDDKKLGIEFESDLDPSMVFADKDSIHQVLYNLTDNAIKFTPEGGTIKILIKDCGAKFNVTVHNTGIGIKREELAFVFDRFYKTDSSRGLDKTGTGLGLYIVKTKLEAHGEKITVDSDYGKFCEFEFTLTKLSQNDKSEEKQNTQERE